MTFDTVWFYLLACIPFFIGGAMWILSKKVNWIEWIGNSAVCFLIAGCFHIMAIHGMTADTETWSGQLVDAKHYAAWREYYEYAVYRTEYYTATESYTDSKGRSSTRTVTRSREVFDHWEPSTRWHADHWETESNINTSYGVDSKFFEYLCVQFKDKRTVRGNRTTGDHNSRMIAGDPNDYETTDRSGWVEPVTKHMSFENRIKAAPSSFSFAPVPDTVKGIFAYPKNDNPFVSDRLLGTALSTINHFAFDQMNARMGPIKKVNVIMIGMGDVDSMLAEWQRSKWIGGKKNDIVIVWGGDNKAPAWVRCFGWSDSEYCKRNLETIVLDNGASTDTLAMIEKEIRLNYVLKDWKKSFAHIAIPAPMWALWSYIGFMVVSQAGLWFWFTHNDFDKDTIIYRTRRGPKYY